MKRTATLLLSLLLLSCNSSKDPKKPLEHTYTVTREAIQHVLYFTGKIEPIRESSLVSPMAATIENTPMHYGQVIQKGELVVILNSTELQRQYNDTLTEYLKAKDNFTVARAKFLGTQNLWEAGLISKNNFISEKSSLNTARITLLQTTHKLSDMLEKMDDSHNKHLSKLSIAEFDKVRNALSSKHRLIHLKAPISGVLLYPPKTGEDVKNQLSIGTSVKAGQVLALVGDVSGLRVEIDVPEIDISKIHPGMKAIVTGIALGRERLQGKLVLINAQALSTTANAPPSFNALVEVNKLTPQQRNIIKIGMSASIAVVIDEGKQLRIPIVAIHQHNGHAQVSLRTANGQRVTRNLSLGTADHTKVVVTEGLREGEVIVYDQ